MLSSLQTLNFKWVEKKDQLTVDSTIKIDQIDDSIHVKKKKQNTVVLEFEYMYLPHTHPGKYIKA